MFMGDCAAQKLEGSEVIDPVRNAVMVSWNSLVFAPVFYYWFGMLDRTWPGVGARNVALKVVTNQV